MCARAARRDREGCAPGGFIQGSADESASSASSSSCLLLSRVVGRGRRRESGEEEGGGTARRWARRASAHRHTLADGRRPRASLSHTHRHLKTQPTPHTAARISTSTRTPLSQHRTSPGAHASIPPARDKFSPFCAANTTLGSGRPLSRSRFRARAFTKHPAMPHPGLGKRKKAKPRDRAPKGQNLRVVKAKTNRGRRVLEAREPKLVRSWMPGSPKRPKNASPHHQLTPNPQPQKQQNHTTGRGPQAPPVPPRRVPQPARALRADRARAAARGVRLARGRRQAVAPQCRRAPLRGRRGATPRVPRGQVPRGRLCARQPHQEAPAQPRPRAPL